MKPKTKQKLHLEWLESRRLLSGIWQGNDADGDDITIKLRGAGDFTVLTQDEGLGLNIETIEVFDTNARSKLEITSRKHGGDGFVDVGEIDAAGEELKQIKVDGNLGFLDVTELGKIKVWGSETQQDESAQWFIDGSVKKMEFLGDLEDVLLDIGGDVNNVRIKGSLDDALVEIGGDLKKAVVHENITAATLLVDGQLRQLDVYGDIEDDSLISALEDINALNVDGFIDFSTIESGGQLKYIYTGYDILDSELFAVESIRSIIVDGAIENSLIESEGSIREIDAWDWIIESDIIAGDGGIDLIIAYDLIDTTVDTPGNLGAVILDVDPHHNWDEFYVPEDDLWYWPDYGDDRDAAVYEDNSSDDMTGDYNNYDGHHHNDSDSHFFLGFDDGTFHFYLHF